MFLDFYNLREQPFGVTPDPRYLYFSSTHREALASLLYGVQCGRGFMTLIAKPGMGKTTLLYCLLERLSETARTAFLFQTQSTPVELFRQLLADLGLGDDLHDIVAMHQRLNEFLVREAESHHQVVVVIDEAQNLSDEVLESVRLLSNFETPRAKLLQIILAGQPPLADKLVRPSLSQLRQRVSIMAQLKPFDRADTERYITHRLRVANEAGRNLFTPQAVQAIATLSKGTPRLINNLCFNALSIGCALHKEIIDVPMVREAAADLTMETLGSDPVAIACSVPANLAAPSKPSLPYMGSVTSVEPAPKAAPSVARQANYRPEASVGRRSRTVTAVGLLTALVLAGLFAARRFSIDQVWADRAPNAAAPSSPALVAESPTKNALSQLPATSTPSDATVTQQDKSSTEGAVLPKFRELMDPAKQELASTADPKPGQSGRVDVAKHTELARRLPNARALPQGASRGARVPIPAQPDPGGDSLLEVQSMPPGAQVSIDGKPVGESPVETTVRPGSHTYRLELAGYFGYESTVLARSGVMHKYSVSLVPDASRAKAAKPAASTTSHGAPSASGEEMREGPLSASLQGGTLTATIPAAAQTGHLTTNSEAGPKALTPTPESGTQAAANEATVPKELEKPTPTPQSPTSEQFRVGGQVETEVPITTPPPEYPPLAAAAHVEGNVELEATIGKDGKVRNIKVLSGPPLLTRAAGEAVSRWRYRPAKLNGEPIEVVKQIEVSFKLPN